MRVLHSMRHLLFSAALILCVSLAVAQSTPAPRLVPGFDQSLQGCYAPVPDAVDMAKQLEACKAAADSADKLPANALERVSVYTATSGAFNKAHQFQEALRYANKAVDSSRQGHGDGLIASYAYAARASAEVNLGSLDAADQDQSSAEEYLRADIRHMDETHVGEFNRTIDIRALKSILLSHAQMLRSKGNVAAAQIRTDEAAKLP